MLVRYKKSCEKIAMGLLSFMPKERELKKLKETMNIYQTNPNWHLFLWKEGEAFVGLVGIEVADGHFTLQHISVNPSFHGEGIGHAMVEKIQQLMPAQQMRGTTCTEAFLKKCSEAKLALI
ncbi:GNAT family N-acetyltransferase [Planomicrobium sp. CPCC 101079]|uniref:GNAT family N-acetyltransferase n=1 Tax=Planomicrobium sp. CPCC 101079 TaxID=2599618 RepID=UPI0011B73D1D|nr:GNAT family N-acetyltransferase [Planomicrobium sp. CPCC 101079]TWT04939.1 GNAT family N-acetyltransferase [Planomicrobium sp. CPCC 101079]